MPSPSPACESLAEFIARLGITLDATEIPTRTDIDLKDWKGASHWACTLKRDGFAPLSVNYSMGAAHRRWRSAAVKYAIPGSIAPHDIRARFSPISQWGEKETIDLRDYRASCTEPIPPTASDILDCLASDACGYDDARTFEDWASNYGYDTDSRKAESIYHTIGQQAKALRHFLGRDYDTLIHKIERL